VKAWAQAQWVWVSSAMAVAGTIASTMQSTKAIARIFFIRNLLIDFFACFFTGYLGGYSPSGFGGANV
jgi:hypothetical protein